MIWNLQEPDNDFNLGPISDEDIIFVEKTYHISLPKTFIKQLKIQNGGYLLTDAIPVDFPSFYAEGFIQFDHLFGIKPREGIMESKSILEEWGIYDDKFIVINGSNWKVALLLIQLNPQQPPLSSKLLDGCTSPAIHSSQLKEPLNQSYV
ncbi:MAG: SMI1/KNR4 family protein [Bacillus sp. (in: firmicutes)]